MQKLREIIKKAALEAGEIILKAKPTDGLHQKEGTLNFATDTDLKCEEVIVNLIKNAFPTHSILSEETDSDIEDPLSEDNLWVIDPLDGTVNFRFEQNYSCTSIAYVEKGITQLAVVYNPYRDELFYAERMQGAFLNGKKISVGGLSDLVKARIATDNAYNHETKQNLEVFLKLNPVSWLYVKGSAVLAMCEVACGRMDLYYHTGLHAWDNAAVFLILDEAGAIIKNIKGEDTNFLTDNVLCGNKDLVEKFLAATN